MSNGGDILPSVPAHAPPPASGAAGAARGYLDDDESDLLSSSDDDGSGGAGAARGAALMGEKEGVITRFADHTQLTLQAADGPKRPT